MQGDAMVRGHVMEHSSASLRGNPTGVAANFQNEIPPGEGNEPTL